MYSYLIFGLICLFFLTFSKDSMDIQDCIQVDFAEKIVQGVVVPFPSIPEAHSFLVYSENIV